MALSLSSGGGQTEEGVGGRFLIDQNYRQRKYYLFLLFIEQVFDHRISAWSR
jgi:hypothetical protein